MRTRILIIAAAFTLAVPALPAQQQNTQPQPQQQQGPKPKSKGEQDALMKVQTAAQSNDPKAMLDAIKNVLENYTDTEYKPMLLDMAVQAAQQSGDLAETQVWGERAIQNDPNDIQARVLMAETIATNTKPTDLDKDQSIKKIQDYANKALDLLKNANTAPVGVQPAQWPALKAQMTSQAYDALGQAADINKNYPEAIKQLQAAVNADPSNAVAAARLTKIYNDAKQYDDAIAAADKVLAMPNLPAQIKNYVTAQKNVATKMKGSAPATATPPPAATK
jgi:tetratricopeptide (TPR) repeat protein